MRDGKNPYAVGELDPRRKLRVGSGVQVGKLGRPRVTARHQSGKIKIVDVCKFPLEKKDRYVIFAHWGYQRKGYGVSFAVAIW